MNAKERPVADRIYSDILASPLRGAEQFLSASTTANRNTIQLSVIPRRDQYRKELSATESEAQYAFEYAMGTWHRTAFGETTQTAPRVRVVSHLTRAAQALLKPDGLDMALCVDRDEPGREILRWRFISLALPSGILVAAATRDGRTREHVHLLNKSIAPDHPVAYNHLHHVAMLSFEHVWAGLRFRGILPSEWAKLVVSLKSSNAHCPGLHTGPCLAHMHEPAPKSRRSDETKAAKRAAHMAEWANVIRQTFFARHILERHVSHGGPLATCELCDCKALANRTWKPLLKGRASPFIETTPYPWAKELRALGRKFYRANGYDTLRRTDGPRRDLIRDEAAQERMLLTSAFAYLRPDANESPDSDYELLFLQYLRIKTAVFGLLTQPPGEPGLANFIKHFMQIKVYAPETEFMRPPPPDEPGLDLRSIEYRIAPDAWFKVIQRNDDDISGGRLPSNLARRRREQSWLSTAPQRHASPAPPPPEHAWLTHFKRHGRKKDTLPLFGSVVSGMKAEAELMIAAINTEPDLLRTFRAVDICGVEGQQPLWVSAETLRHVRNKSRAAAAKRPSHGLEPLRLTVHAGEDFKWLTSGIRAVAEPFHWKLIERGDRIGHGIAITMDPKLWWSRHMGNTYEVKRIDRLLDLAFLAHYTEHREGRTEGHDKWLAKEIHDTAKDLGFCLNQADGTNADLVTTAKDMWYAIGRGPGRRLLDTRRQPARTDPLHEQWLHSYFWRKSTQKLADELVHMKVDHGSIREPHDHHWHERDLLIIARNHLIREIARWQVSVESNPSSNLIVGGLDSMSAQDFLQTRPTREKELGKETLTWTISTDDPITFSTTLADEYAYAWAGMVLREENPYDPAYARSLLDEAAQTSMRMRFTGPRRGSERIR